MELYGLNGLLAAVVTVVVIGVFPFFFFFFQVLFSPYVDCIFQEWDFRLDQPVGSFHGHTAAVSSLVVLDSATIASASRDKSLKASPFGGKEDIVNER